jgi:hypothetical protein
MDAPRVYADVTATNDSSTLPSLSGSISCTLSVMTRESNCCTTPFKSSARKSSPSRLQVPTQTPVGSSSYGYAIRIHFEA